MRSPTRRWRSSPSGDSAAANSNDASIPLGAEFAPVVAAALIPFVELPKESRVPHRRPEASCIFEQLLAEVEAGHWRVGMQAPDIVGVASEDRRFDIPRPDHMVGHHQEAFAVQQGVIAGDDASELRHGARFHIPGQQQVQHGHEVRLARAEGAVEVAGGASAALDAAADETEGLVESALELGGDDVVLDRLRGRAPR